LERCFFTRGFVSRNHFPSHSCSSSRGSEAHCVALRCGGVFDGRGDSLRKNVVILVEGEKIKELAGSAHRTFSPQGTQRFTELDELIIRSVFEPLEYFCFEFFWVCAQRAAVICVGDFPELRSGIACVDQAGVADWDVAVDLAVD